jgi:hypothetical protein
MSALLQREALVSGKAYLHCHRPNVLLYALELPHLSFGAGESFAARDA